MQCGDVHLLKRQNLTVRTRTYKCKHNQICIQAVQAVALVWFVVRRALLMANVLHDLVLTLTRNVMPC